MADNSQAMKGRSAVVSIRAPKELVWSILTDSTSYSQWNPAYQGFDGQLALGEKVEVCPNGQDMNRFHVTVDELVQGRKMVWRRAFPFGSVCIRTFLLRQLSQGIVEFETRESFKGLFGEWLRRRHQNRQSFDQLAVALKRHAELLATAAIQDAKIVEADSMEVLSNCDGAAEATTNGILAMALAVLAEQHNAADYCPPTAPLTAGTESLATEATSSRQRGEII